MCVCEVEQETENGCDVLILRYDSAVATVIIPHDLHNERIIFSASVDALDMGARDDGVENFMRLHENLLQKLLQANLCV